MSGHDREMQPIDFAVQGEYSHNDYFLSVFLSLFLSTVCISSNHKLELYGSFAFGEQKHKNIMNQLEANQKCRWKCEAEHYNDVRCTMGEP